MMMRIRIFEMAVREHFHKGEIPGFAHLYVGEEAVATGVCTVLGRDDYIASTHRGHGHCIAKGADLKRLMAELYGRQSGYCEGRGGSMHIFAREIGILGTCGIVGGGLPIALGAAMHSKLKKTGQVCAAFFGDGAANNATFHESLNLAAVKALPVIFVCENNLYATATSVQTATKTRNFADRAPAYGMPGVVVDGNDVMDVLRSAEEAVQRARAGKGPTLLECKTYRHFGHYIGENTFYRSKEEVEAWLERDPIKTFSRRLEEEGTLSAEQVETLRQEVAGEVAEAVKFASESPFPDPARVGEYLWSGK